MNKKSKKAQRKQMVEQYRLEHPPTYTEGHWEEAMLENDSYYDIDIINKHNTPILKKIKKLTEQQSKAVNWLGKWYWQVKIDRERAKLKHYESKS